MQLPRYVPFKYKLALSISLSLILLAVALGYIYQKHLVYILEEDYTNNRRLLEEKAVSSLQYMDNVVSAISSFAESDMKDIAHQLLLDYEMHHNPGLLAVRRQGKMKGYHLYVIDGSNRIIHTDDAADAGLDLGKSKNLTRMFDRVRERGVFGIDGVNLSTMSKKTTLFGSCVTADRKYILELGLDIGDTLKKINLQEYSAITEEIVEKNSIVNSIYVFRVDGRQFFGSLESFSVQPADLKNLRKSIRINSRTTGSFVKAGRKMQYIYIPVVMKSTRKYGNEVKAIEIVFNNDYYERTRSINRLIIFLIVVLALILSFVLVIFISRKITKPIDEITKSIIAVQSGTYEPISIVASSDEFGFLSEKFNAMIIRIKSLLEEDRQKQEKIEQSYLVTVRALVNAIEAKDEYTRGHCERVTGFAHKIGAHIGLTAEQMRSLEFACLLHDIGKIGIPAHVLRKQEDLDADESGMLREHPLIGYNILEGIDFLCDSRDIILQHHERPDGRGYPKGLSGDDIRIEARILSAVDAYDAMTTLRPYRGSVVTHIQACDELRRNAGLQFYPEIVEAAAMVLECADGCMIMV
jgi:HD-GYP domain-containing protein (c-di-GMP phosphodiesterase class II)